MRPLRWLQFGLVAAATFGFARPSSAVFILGTNDIQSRVNTYDLTTNPIGATSFASTLPTGVRPRGIVFDPTTQHVYVAISGGDTPATNVSSIQVYNTTGTLLSTIAATGLPTNALDGLTIKNGVLYATNAYVYNNQATQSDPNVYAFTLTNGGLNATQSVFGAAPTTGGPLGQLWNNGLRFGTDGNLYVVQQGSFVGPSTGTGDIVRLSAAGALLGTVTTGFGSIFGVTFDSTGNLIFGSGSNIYRMLKTGTDANGNTFAAPVVLASNVNPAGVMGDVFVASDGLLYATSFSGSSTVALYQIDLATGAVLKSTTPSASLANVKSDFLAEVIGAPVPEPSSLVSLGCGAVLLLGVVSVRSKRNRDRSAA